MRLQKLKSDGWQGALSEKRRIFSDSDFSFRLMHARKFRMMSLVIHGLGFLK